MFVTTRTAALFAEAARQIEQRGWVQGIGMAQDGRVCMVGAIAKAIHSLKHQGYSGFVSAAGNLHDALGMRPTAWNDMPGRTKEEVVAKLREITARHVTLCFR